ncbi:MAG: phosphorylase [Proteobacteria bacterium]|nr:phosphorylase [Pseudomonadota bacterium]
MSEPVVDEGDITLERGTLWERTVSTTKRAIRSGVQQPIATTWQTLTHCGIEFLVRRLTHLHRKTRASEQADSASHSLPGRAAERVANPFLPYDENLWVADISTSHVCLLNKFNVIDYHLLIVTREFREQEEPLNSSDFAAMWACLAEFDGLVFYNSGPSAGASQRHKHLQMVPLPLIPDRSDDSSSHAQSQAARPRIPIAPLLTPSQPVEMDDTSGRPDHPPGGDSIACPGQIAIATGLPFVHAVVALDPALGESPDRAARHTLHCYHAMLRALGLVSTESTDVAPYNLLVTREWMLVVARSRECFGPISVNALGFSGSFFVRNESELQTLAQLGPLAVLQSVAIVSGGSTIDHGRGQ